MTIRDPLEGEQSPQCEAPDAWADRFRQFFIAGELSLAEQFFERFPESRESDLSAAHVIYEEYCLRRERDELCNSTELYRRFPEFKSKLAIVLDCDRVLHETPAIQFPKPGEHFHEFHLLRELGRGAYGCVYLATQPSLSDRLVVIKLYASGGHEHLSLARLQHSAIVPLLLSLEDKSLGIRMMAMPYLGGCTLDQVIEELMVVDTTAGQPASFRPSGNHIAEIIGKSDRVTPGPDACVNEAGPAIQFLQSATFEQAVCWIAACLAEGLHHAHQRGLLHLDVKPSNVLIAADGQPMLLDFHLARSKDHLHGVVESLGGTPGYMSPEHRSAVAAVARGDAISQDLDERSDIFSLGLVIRDLLTGTISPPVETLSESPSRRFDQLTSGIPTGSTALKSILTRCLAHDPSDRFSDASQLANALRNTAFESEPPSENRRGLFSFAAGAFVATVICLGSRQLVPTAPIAEPNRSTTTDIQMIDMMHSFISRVRETDLLANASAQERDSLARTCRDFLDRESQMQAGIDDQAYPAMAKRLTNDLEDVITLLQELSEHTESPVN